MGRRFGSAIGLACAGGLAADLLAWATVTIVIASVAGAALSLGAGQVLSAALDAAVGRPGEYDALVQLRQEASVQARAELETELARRYGGARLRWGPSAAGTATLLVDLPSRWESAALFEAFDGLLRQIPGFVAWTPLLEPSVTLQAVHPSVRELAKREASRTPGVRFAFVHGGDVVVVTRSPAALEPVVARLQRWVDGRAVYRLTPEGERATGIQPQQAARAARSLPGVRVLSAGPARVAAPALEAWAERLRELVLAYATVARIEPVSEPENPSGTSPASALQVGDRVRIGPWEARVVQSDPGQVLAVVVDPIPPTSSAGAGAGEAAPGTPGEGAPVGRWPVRKDGKVVGEATLQGARVELDRALGGVEAVLRRLGDSTRHVAEVVQESAQALERLRRMESWFGPGGPGQERAGPWQALVALALRVILAADGPARASPTPPGSSRGDSGALQGVGELGRRLEEVQAQLRTLGEGDARAALEGLRRLRSSLQALTGEEALAFLELVDQAGGAAERPAQAELVLEGRPPPQAGAIREILARAGGRVRVHKTPVATVTPSPRATVLGVMERARAGAGALGSVAVVGASLLSDWACGAALAREWVRLGREGRRKRVQTRLLLGGVVMGTLMAGAAAVPVSAGHQLAWAAAAASGGALGLVASRLAHRLAPVSAESVEAARAFGMDLRRVLWEVAAPESRPWLMAWMAQRRTALRPKGGPLRRQGVTSGGQGACGADVPDTGSSGVAGAVLEARALVRDFGGRRALDGFSLKLAAGEVVVLMGPSGCGKSTALRCLAGLCEPDAGQVRLFGQDLWEAGPQDRGALLRQLAIVFQRPQLVRHLNVAQNVALPLVAAGLPLDEANERAMAALEAVGLGHLAGALPDGLSGGEAQRAAIARALAWQPKIMLWDEPTAHLDPVLVADLVGLVQELAGGLRTTMLIATHEVRFALRVAHRLALVEGGRVVEEGIPELVLKRPRSEVGRSLSALMAL